MKTKIEIKTFGGSVLFELKIEDNDIKNTLEKAVGEGANLRGANLRGAYLEGAKNIPQSYINMCSRDILFILQALKKEVPFLRKKLIKGEVDGTQYEGECACLIGTLANADGSVEEVCGVIPYYEKGLHNPGEQWFFQIKKGDNPENSFFAEHALKLVDEVLGKKKSNSKKK